MTRKQAIKWLKKLNDETNKFYPAREGSKIGSIHPTRSLTEAEWMGIKEIIAEHNLPCLLRPTSYGFTLCVHENKDVTIFSKNPPKMLLMIEHCQFPLPSAKNGFAGQMTTLLELAPLTHGAKNKSLLSQHGFEPLREIEHYEY